MSPLADDTYYDASDNPTELIPHPNPPQSFLDGLREGGQRITHGMAHFLYYAVAPGSRMGYNSYIESHGHGFADKGIILYFQRPSKR